MVAQPVASSSPDSAMRMYSLLYSDIVSTNAIVICRFSGSRVSCNLMIVY